MTDRDELRDRGWSDDVEVRQQRRPRQRIAADEGRAGGEYVITPSWQYGCVECGETAFLATEDLAVMQPCENCGDSRIFEPLGELEYPDRKRATAFLEATE